MSIEYNSVKKEELYFTCGYDEKSFDSYKGIEVQCLHSDKILDTINTGNVCNDLEVAYKKYINHHLIVHSSSIDNYHSDILVGKELCND
ncbi:hypothetical protein ACSVDA_10850 [Cytobacillus sp. Hm23]